MCNVVRWPVVGVLPTGCGLPRLGGLRGGDGGICTWSCV